MPAAKNRSKLGLIRGIAKDAIEHLTTAEKMHRPADADGQLAYAEDRLAEALEAVRRRRRGLAGRHGG